MRGPHDGVLAERLDAANRMLGAERVVCGAASPDPDVERAIVAMRAAEGFFDDGTGCGVAGRWTAMYRCLDCGRFFHRACLIRHFARHGGGEGTRH